MGKMRVFELARELNIPSKQLIQKMHGLGLKTDSNFHVLTEEQITFIRSKFATGATGTDDFPVRRGRVIRRDKASEQDSEEQSDKRPRRIRKGRKPVVAVEPEKVEVEKEIVEKEPETVAIEPEITPTEVPVVESSSEEEPLPIEPIEPEETPDLQIKSEPPPVDEAKAVEATPEELPTETVVAPEEIEEVSPSPAVEAEASKPVEAEETEEASAKKQKFSKKSKKRQDEVEEEVPKKTGRDHKKDRKSSRYEDDEFVSNRPKKSVKKVYIIDEEDGVDRNRRRRKRKDKQKSKAPEKKHTFNPRKKSIKIGNTITVGELAGQIGIKATEIIKKLMALGIMASINQNISGENAALIAAEFEIEVELDTSTEEDKLAVEEGTFEEFSRSPIVTIMGHVDHGKTSLLDKIRTTQVTEGEAGGITQHIGAYNVKTDQGNITFLDTPGHEAFTAMRARGANVTDIVILVVAADDGVQPQTIEAIHHAQAADVPIIVVINKIDRPEANPSRIQQELLEHGLVSEDFGGDTIFVKASAKTGDGLDNLLEMIHLQAEILELRAPVEGRARGVIVESQMSLGKGPVGTVLIQAGTLKVGDQYLVGETFGKVRALYDDCGQLVESAGPSTPIEVLGFKSIPATGEHFIVVEDEKTARQIAENRVHRSKAEVAVQQQKMHLENLFGRINSEENVELKLLIKADVHGSAEALESSLSQLGNEKVSVSFLHTAIGSITENDVLLASASDAIIIGFNTNLDAKAKILNSREGVDIRIYNVIYDAIEDVKKALEGLLKPTLREELIGKCDVRQIFSYSKSGQILGCYVTEGKIQRDASVKIYRQNELIHEGSLVSLKRFKDDVREVLNNYECGVVVDSEDVQIGDVVEAYIQVEEVAKL